MKLLKNYDLCNSMTDERLTGLACTSISPQVEIEMKEVGLYRFVALPMKVQTQSKQGRHNVTTMVIGPLNDHTYCARSAFIR